MAFLLTFTKIIEYKSIEIYTSIQEEYASFKKRFINNFFENMTPYIGKPIHNLHVL